MKRIIFFIATNIAILIVLSIFLSLTGFTGILQSNGVDLDYDSLMLFSLVFGMGGSSLSSKLLIQFLNTKDLNSKIFIYDNPYDELIEKNVYNDLNILNSFLKNCDDFLIKRKSFLNKYK